MVISMISKLATLALVMAAGALQVQVVFFAEQNCDGLSFVYPVQLKSDGCNGKCVDLNNNFQSVSMEDPQNLTTCYIFDTPGCNGNYSSFTRVPDVSTSILGCSNAETSTGVTFTMGSASCFRDECTGR
jgi:hypothetical protein